MRYARGHQSLGPYGGFDVVAAESWQVEESSVLVCHPVLLFGEDVFIGGGFLRYEGYGEADLFDGGVDGVYSSLWVMSFLEVIESSCYIVSGLETRDGPDIGQSLVEPVWEE